MAQNRYPEARDPFCNRPARAIPEYVEIAKEEGYEDADQWVRLNEGTYNETGGYFACTECYIKMGQPTAPGGWKVGTLPTGYAGRLTNKVEPF